MGKRHSVITSNHLEDVANAAIGTKKEYRMRPVELYWSGYIPLIKHFQKSVRERLDQIGVPSGRNPWPILIEFHCGSEDLHIYNLILLRDYGYNRLTVLFPSAYRVDSQEEMDTANADPSVLCVGFDVPEPHSKEFHKLHALIVVRIIQMLDKSLVE